MKLKTKLTLFNAMSKLVIVILFVLLLPVVIKNINESFTDSKLRKQKDKVLDIVKRSGVDENLYAAYSPLKEEYYSLDVDSLNEGLDTIKNEKRKIEGDTIEYRILSHNFKIGNKNYLLEIGKSADTIGETTSPLRTAEGYRILKLVTREPAGQRELSDPKVQQTIRETLINRKDQLLKAAYYEMARNEAKVVNYFVNGIVGDRQKK